MDDKRLGQILLRLDLITQSQLDHCVEFLAECADSVPVPEDVAASPPEDNVPTDDEVGTQTPEEGVAPARPLTLADVLLRQNLIDEKTLATVCKMKVKRLDAELQEADDRYANVKSRLVDADMEEFLRVARELGASDLFMTPGEPPTIRLHGRLEQLPAEPLAVDRCRELVSAGLSEKQLERLARRKHVDLSVSIEPGGRFRANIFQHTGGTGGIFRVIADQVVPFKDLNLPDTVRDFIHFTQGLVLVTGATGSGKSTTLASLIDILNHTYRLHIVSLEEPIEVVHKSQKSLITQREVPSHSDTFATGLRAALREDADVIVVGEMRDPETVATALTAAETGHLVLGTLHTRDAYSTILRVVDQFPVHKRSHVRTILARVLRAVVCQELVPTAGGDGRILASEVMIVNQAISNLIREDRSWQINSVIQMSGHQGMQLMDDCLEELVRTGKISRRDALARAAERERFEGVPSHG